MVEYNLSTIACPSTLLARRYSFHSLRMNLNRALTCLCPPWVQVVYLVCYLLLHHLWLLAWWVWGGLSLCGPGASSQQWSIPVLWLAYCTGILAAITFAVSAGEVSFSFQLSFWTVSLALSYRDPFPCLLHF